MCGIAGFYNPRSEFLREEGRWQEILRKMNQAQKHRGPDEEGVYLSDRCGFGHVRLSVIDLVTGHQPMIRKREGKEFAIVYNGEVYNMAELRRELEEEGAVFDTTSDTEVILVGYMLHGEGYIKKLNGIFAMGIWDGYRECMYLFRDRLGVKPLFYRRLGETLVFSSEMKGLFAYPGIEAEIDKEGLCEIFALGPAKSYGKGVFRNILEVLPGHFICLSKGICREVPYWKLESRSWEDSFEKTVEKTAWLVEDAVKLQMISDVPISTFLSGGVDSSLVTAVCARELKKKGKTLDTYSFDFQENGKYFQSNSFQPSQDRPYVDKMVEFAQTNHRYLECRNVDLMDYLFRAVDARDLPCMADVESSLLYFCSEVVKENKVALTGECADEIFGGYPWFHKKEAFETPAFPWSMSMVPRKVLLKDELTSVLPMEEYARQAYERTIKETPVLEGESGVEKRRREIAYLNLRWFMVTLLDRMDRTSMYCGLEARVPLADYRIVEYVWNVPWEMKCPDGIVKGLLRHAGEGKLPKEVLWRKKSPYPKTYHPEYERILGGRLLEILRDSQAPIRQLLDIEKAEKFVKSPQDYGKPWYGQLMAGPQMLAYMLQVNYWLEKYNIRLV